MVGGRRCFCLSFHAKTASCSSFIFTLGTRNNSRSRMVLKDILTIFPQVKLANWQKTVIILGIFLVLDLAGLTPPITTAINRNLLPVKKVWIGGFNQVFGFWKDVEKLPKAIQRIQ